MQPGEIDELSDPGFFGGAGDGGGRVLLHLLEVLPLVAHGVDQVEGDVHPRHNAGDILRFSEVGLDQFHSPAPIEALQAGGPA